MHGFKMLELDCFVALDLKKYLHCKNSVGQMFPVGLFIQALSCFSVPGTEFSIYLTDCCGLYKNEKWIQLQKQLLYYSVKFTYGSNRIERSIHCQKKKRKSRRGISVKHIHLQLVSVLRWLLPLWKVLLSVWFPWERYARNRVCCAVQRLDFFTKIPKLFP